MRLRERKVRMKAVATMLAVLWALVIAGAPRAWAQETSLVMQSEAGEFIGQGKNYNFTTQTGTFTAQARDFDNDGKIKVVEINYRSNGAVGEQVDNFSVNFSTRKLGVPLALGAYEGAQRYPFEEAGHPGLSILGNGRGFNKSRGSFVIEQLEFDTSDATEIKVARFSASFVQTSDRDNLALRGTIKINATTTQPPTGTPTPVPTATVAPPPPNGTPTPVPTATIAPTPGPPPTNTPTPAPPGSDRTAPTATFTTPMNGQVLKALPALRGQISDNAGGSGIAGVEVTILRFDGKTWSGNTWEDAFLRVPGIVVGDQWGFNKVPRGADLPEGIYRIAVWPLDRAGNRGRTIIALRIDTTPPQLRWAAPNAGVQNMAPRLYAVQVLDIGGIESVMIAIQRNRDGAYWNGRAWQRAAIALPAQYSGSYGVLRMGAPPAAALDAGSYLLLAIVTDRAGNSNRATQSLVLREKDNPSTPDNAASPVRLSNATARGALNAIDLVFTGPLQIASLHDATNFRVRVAGRETEITSKNYAASDNRVTLQVDGVIAPGARIEIAFKGLRDSRGAPLAAGSVSFEAPR